MNTEKGKVYFYESKTRGGAIRHGRLVRTTPAWLIFDNGDWIESFSPLYETKEELVNVRMLVGVMHKNTYVPNVAHLPIAFTQHCLTH